MKKTRSDVYDINRKTGALIIGKNRLDDYATKILNKYCPAALSAPMALPVNKIIERMGLNLEHHNLSENHDVLGCCTLLEGNVPIYQSKTKRYEEKYFDQGTIIIESSLSKPENIGRYRNTLIHELIHWEKDKKYFEILRLRHPELMEDLYPLMQRQSKFHFEPAQNKQTDDNQIMWLEWQAHRIAPRILMPKNTFKSKAEEILKKEKSCDDLIQKLSDFFVVSRSSTKYRLLEVGLESKMGHFDDYEDVFAPINNRTDYVKISLSEAYSLLESNESLSDWINTGRYMFVDGYFVIANTQYVQFKNGRFTITKKALKNIKQCALNISEINTTEYKNLSNDFYGISFLYRCHGVSNQILIYHPEFQVDLKDEDKAYGSAADMLNSLYNQKDEIELVRMIDDPEITICDCLLYLFEKRSWDNKDIFNDETELDTNYFYKIRKNNMNNISEKNLIAICVGLKLTLHITEKLLEKSGVVVKNIRYQSPFNTYFNIMERFPGLPLSDFNSLLEELEVEPLGTKRINE
ncbi:ImmA/IrrE family metallo-endopeptidase [Hutsoniella sourekii]|uniref:ImmA/IrrE family metallo-endopeptidase n=1 Tax=Hutsoniella sourekii TaxID=87650 RepID=UPI000480ED61|nr:ImmA/IrrE family metallo-endopeptidase [Hutsoniella sourekii]